MDRDRGRLLALRFGQPKNGKTRGSLAERTVSTALGVKSHLVERADFDLE